MPAKLHNDLIKILNRNNKYILNLTSFIMSLSQAITIFLHNLLTSVSPMKLTLTILLLLNVIRDTSAFTASRTQRILTHYLDGITGTKLNYAQANAEVFTDKRQRHRVLHHRRAAQRRNSTLGWLKAYLSGNSIVREQNLMELSMMMSDKTSDDDSINNDEPIMDTESPINILVMDGGGMRGYASLAIIKEMSAMLDHDFLDSFDLIGGTSAGGIGSLVASRSENTMDFLDCGTSILEELRLGTFSKWCFRRLFSEGVLMKYDEREDVFKRNIEARATRKGRSRKAFALAAKWNESTSSVEPFVMRTYDVSKEDGALPGTHNIPICKAMAATSACPIAFARTTFTALDENGNFQHKLCDGCLVSNSPVSIALREAKTIWPNRPIGTVLSLGLESNKKEDDANQAAIDIVNAFQSKRNGGSQVKYARLVSPASTKMQPAEVCRTKIDNLEAEARKYARESEIAMSICSELRGVKRYV